METILNDARYAVRTLLQRPGFALVAVAALALGIGANTAIFSVVNTVLLRPLPFEHPERLVTLSTELRRAPQDGRGSFSVPDLLDVQARASTLEYVATYQRSGTVLTEGGEPERIIGAAVNADYFPLFGVKPALGRVFTREEDRPGAESVIVLSHGLWQRRFGGDPTIIGRQITLGAKTTVIGVMPQGFEFPIRDDSQDYWEPIFSAPFMTKAEREVRGSRSLSVVARLKPGASIEQARAELDALSRQIERQSPESNTDVVFNAVSLHEEMTRDYRPALLVLLGAVALVLLIACANVANLLLARATARQKEIAIRTALGASRGRIVRQLLTESLLLSLVGGGAGLLLAAWGLDVLVAAGPADVPRLRDVHLDGQVLGFTLGVSALTSVLFGLVPALQASRPDPGDSLKEGGRGSTEGGRGRMRGALIVAEVALSLMLLVGAGLLIRSFVRLLGTDAGFDAERVLALDIPLSRSKYPQPEQQAAVFRQLVERMRAVPGVREAGVVSNLPLSNLDYELSFEIEGRPPSRPGEEPSADYTVAGADYFGAMKMRLLRGRLFDDRDTPEAPPAMLVSDAFARRFFPGEDPLGKRIRIDGEEGKHPPREIVGVVGDVRRGGLDVDAEPEFYVSYLQSPERRLNLVLSTETPDAASLTQAARAAVREFDPNQLIWRTQTMDELLGKSLAPRRFNMMLLATFAGVALVLAGVGLYGVMSYTVTRRTHEIGIRMALGAQRGDVLRLVVSQGLALTLVGVALGLACALALSRVLTSLLFGISATDPLTYAVVALLLVAVALVACLVPARRATKVDPMVALRYE